MKTEREQLEENTRMAKAQQTADELKEYYMKLLDNVVEQLRWTLRSPQLLIGVFIAHLVTAVYMSVMDMSPDFMSMIGEFYQILLIVCIFRDFYHENRFAKAQGELEGCEETLRILGYLPPRGEKRKKVAMIRSPYQRFKEFWERVGKSKKAYA